MKPRSPAVLIALVVGAIVALNVGLREVDRRTRSPGGPESSSFATAPDGVAAYAELLRRNGRPVIRLREPPADATLDPAATVVVLEPRGLRAADGDALRHFVERGGLLVAGGTPDGWLDEIVSRPPSWSGEASTAARAVGVPGVGPVRTAGEGAWAGPGRVLVRAGGRPIVLVRRLGRGRTVLVADPSPLQNRLLGEADNAALGLALAGRRPVAFAESVHGYGAASGLDAIPARWWWVFGGLGLAALVLALARGRRLGPPELPDRELSPARVEFAEALATQLAKTRSQADGVHTARRLVRVRLLREVGLYDDATDDEIRAAAAVHGVATEVVEAALGRGASDGELLALGRALRRLEREEAMA
jgi:hypothetical protein